MNSIRLAYGRKVLRTLSLVILVAVLCNACKSQEVPETSPEGFVIDGLADDWIDQAEDPGDEAGDNVAGYLDMTQGYTVFKEGMLYFFINVANPEMPYEQFDVYIWHDNEKYIFFWKPGQETIVALTQPGMIEVGELTNSEFAFNDGFEGRVDPKDLGLEGEISLFKINVMIGEGDNWQKSDQWKPYIEGMPEPDSSTSKPTVRINAYCGLFDQSPQTVEDDQPVVLFWNWHTMGDSYRQDYVDAASFSLALDGQDLDVSQAELKMNEDENGFYAVWNMPALIMSKGSHEVILTQVLDKQVSDGTDMNGDGEVDIYEAGTKIYPACQIVVE